MASQAKPIVPCEIGASPHTWRAMMGGPFGWTETDADGFLQICSECGIKRPPMLLEHHMVATIKGLRSALAARVATLKEIEARLAAVTITGGANAELADAIEWSRDTARAALRGS